MNSKISLILLFIITLAASGCGPGQLLGPTLTPLPTATSTSTATPLPTQTLTPTPTPTLIPISYNPVPRWMILAQPAYSVEILGEKWNYTNDGWNDSSACISYTRERAPYFYFEQCFGMVQEGITFESQLDSFLKLDFETLTPKNTFNNAGQVGLVAKRLEENGERFVKVFEMVGTEKYILLVEMNVVTDNTAPLQKIYESQAADTIDYVLQNGLEKSHLLPRPTATPLSPKQESFYTALEARLISELEASRLYGSTWEAIGDTVSNERSQVCRTFEDRSNADVRWVTFQNCVFMVKGFPLTFDEIPSLYQKPGDTALESHHKYNDKFLLYGYQDGHTYFAAYLLHGEQIYSVDLESRTLGDEKVEDVFNEDIDDFLYGVLMANMQK